MSFTTNQKKLSNNNFVKCISKFGNVIKWRCVEKKQLLCKLLVSHANCPAAKLNCMDKLAHLKCVTIFPRSVCYSN